MRVRILSYVDLGPVLALAAAVVVLAALTSGPALRRGDRRSAMAAAARVLLAGSVLAVLLLTLTGTGTGVGRSVNVVPLDGLRLSITNLNVSLGVANIVGNVLLFAPLGAFGVLASRLEAWRVVAAGCTLSVGLESAQYWIGRAADIDDVLLNTLGAALGAIVAVSVRRSLKVS